MNQRDILARVEWAAEAIEDGDPGVAHAVLLDLRDELLEAVDVVDEERS